MSGWMQHADKCCNDCDRTPDPLECIIVREGIDNTGEIVGFLVNVDQYGFRWTNRACSATSTGVIGALESARFCNPKCLLPQDPLNFLSCAQYGPPPGYPGALGNVISYPIYGSSFAEASSHPAGWPETDSNRSTAYFGMYLKCAGITLRRVLKWTPHDTGGGVYSCSSLDVTFTLPVGVDEDCTSVTRTNLDLDWYVAGEVFTLAGTNYFLQECNATYPRTPEDAPPCFSGESTVEGRRISYLFGSSTSNVAANSLCGGLYYGNPGNLVNAHQTSFGWYISADHDTVVVYAIASTLNAFNILNWPYANDVEYAAYEELPYSASTPWWEDHLPLTLTGANGFTATISAVDPDCNEPTNPPPPQCAPYACYPACVVCEDDGVINAILIFVNIDGVDFELVWNETETGFFYTGASFDNLSITCVATNDPDAGQTLRINPLFGVDYTTTIHLSCTNNDMDDVALSLPDPGGIDPNIPVLVFN